MKHVRLTGAVLAVCLLFSCWQDHVKPQEPPVDNLPPLERGSTGNEVDLSGTWRTRLPSRTKYLKLADGSYSIHLSLADSGIGDSITCERGMMSIYGDKVSFEGTRFLTTREGAVSDSFSMAYSYRYRLAGDTLYCTSPGSETEHVYFRETAQR
jgi:hypothetical protein